MLPTLSPVILAKIEVRQARREAPAAGNVPARGLAHVPLANVGRDVAMLLQTFSKGGHV